MDELLELVARERQNGYRDSAVFGGFGAYLSQWADRRQQVELVRLGENYAQTPLEGRGALLDQIETILGTLQPESNAPVQPDPVVLEKAKPAAEAPALAMPIQT